MNFNPQNYAKLDSYFIIIIDKYKELMKSANSLKDSLKDNYYKSSDLYNIWSNIGTIRDELIGHEYSDGSPTDDGIVGYRNSVFKIINSLTNISFSDLESVINSCKATVYDEFTEIEGTGDFFKQGLQSHNYTSLSGSLDVLKEKLNDPTLTESEREKINKQIEQLQLQKNYLDSVKQVKVNKKYQERTDNIDTKIELAKANKKEREAFVAIYLYKEKTVGLTEEEKVALECAKTDIKSYMYQQAMYTSQKSIEEGTAFNEAEENVKIKEYNYFIEKNNTDNINKQMIYLENKQDKTPEEIEQLNQLLKIKTKMSHNEYNAEQDYYTSMGSLYKNDEYFIKSNEALEKDMINNNVQEQLGINDPNVFYAIEEVCATIFDNYKMVKNAIEISKNVYLSTGSLTDGLTTLGDAITSMADGHLKLGTDLYLSTACDVVSLIPGVYLTYKADNDGANLSISVGNYKDNYTIDNRFDILSAGFKENSLLTDEEESLFEEVGYKTSASMINLGYAVSDGTVGFYDNVVDSVTMFVPVLNEYTVIDLPNLAKEHRKKYSFYGVIDNNSYGAFKCDGGIVYSSAEGLMPTVILAGVAVYYPNIASVLSGMNKAGAVFEDKLKGYSEKNGGFEDMDLGKHYNYVLNGVLQGLVEGLIWKYTYGNSAWNSTSKAGGVIGKVAKYMRVTKEGADKLYSLTTLGKVLIEGSKAYAIDAIDAGLDSDVDFNLLGTSVKSVGNMLSVYLYEKTFGPVIKKVTEKFIKVPESSASNNVEEVVNNVEETIDDIIPTEKPLSPSSILSTDKSSKTDIVVFENKKSVDWYDENVVLSNVKTSIGKVTGKPVKDIMKEYAGLGINYVLGNE